MERMMNAHTQATKNMTNQDEVSVETAYAEAINAKTVGTKTVAPNATYLRCSQSGHRSSVSVPAPESQKKMCLKR